MTRPPLLVFLTVDTEIWPFTENWRETGLKDETARYIDGVTASGSFGLPYQLERLSRHGLRGVFFVEALFACELGLEPLRRIVTMIREGGHDVELHLHPEWLARMTRPVLPGRTGRNMHEFDEGEQSALIAAGVENLRACGVDTISAFRAGNFGANHDTLRALRQNRIPYDSSYNLAYLSRTCRLRTPSPMLQVSPLEGIHEFPVTSFEDYPGHARPVQLCAISSREAEHVFEEAWRRGWHSVVWVSHSFELLKRRIRPGAPALTDRVAIARFDRLCHFLASNRERFRTAGFDEVDAASLPEAQPTEWIRSHVLRTALRLPEQVLSQLL